MTFRSTPTLSKVIQAHLERRLASVHVSMPAEVVSYDRNTQKVKVQPSLKRLREEGQVIDWPVISDVPVLFERTNTFSMTYEIKPGDSGAIIVSERSLDKWKLSGGKVDPEDFRQHDISDAFFIPGLFDFSNNAPVEQNITLWQNDKTQMAMNETGQFRFKNLESGEEYVTIVVDLIQQLIDSLIRTGLGPQPFVPSTIAAFEDLKARLETLKE